ncbi:MAG TPA: hypothetical protein VGL38_06465 [bacterium]|jgi:hypothetical protein
MKTFNRSLAAIALVLLSLVLITGCNRLDTPTSSQPTTEDGMGLWNPGADDHVVPGDQIPMYRPGFLEREWGMAVNPLNIPNATAHIGPEGGIIRLGRHSLTIPAGAVDADITFKISGASLTAIASDCAPSGLVFAIPATLTLSYAGTQYEDAANPDLSIFYALPDGTYEEYPSTVDPVNKTVSAPLNHFSRYILSGMML